MSQINRKKFLKWMTAGSAALTLSGYKVSAINSLLNTANKNTVSIPGKILVTVNLVGGNDGLNTLIALDQYEKLYNARKNILIPANKTLKVNGVDSLGFHPSLGKMQQLYNDGLMNIVQGVGYDNPSFSHFRSIDIYSSASESNQFITSGWLGRYLSAEHPTYPTGYPDSKNPDPLILDIGATMSNSSLGPNCYMGMVVDDLENFVQLPDIDNGTATSTRFEKEIAYINFIERSSQSYYTSIQAAAQKSKNLSPLYPSDNTLADQLKIVARLVNGGLKTQIYNTKLGGFDFHASQTDSNDPTQGKHADLLSKLSDAVFAFMDDLKRMGKSDDVCVMVQSEFGRRIISNGSFGTDHGTAQPFFFFGNSVNPGIIGGHPMLPDHAVNKDNIPFQYDFRRAYSSVLEDWLGFSKSSNSSDVLANSFETLPIFKKQTQVLVDNNVKVSQNYPNPFSESTSVQFYCNEQESIRVDLCDVEGKAITNLLNDTFDSGAHVVEFNLSWLQKGLYILRFNSKNVVQQLKIVKA